MLLECRIEQGIHLHKSHKLDDKWYCVIYTPYPDDTYYPYYLQPDGKFGLCAHWFDTAEEIRAILLTLIAIQFTNDALITRNQAFSVAECVVYDHTRTQ